MFNIGQKIVCVDGSFTDVQRALVDHVVVEGQTYVVRAIRVSADADKLIMDRHRDVDYGVLLVGITNNPVRKLVNGELVLKQEPCYRASRFRGLKEMQASERNLEKATA